MLNNSILDIVKRCGIVKALTVCHCTRRPLPCNQGLARTLSVPWCPNLFPLVLCNAPIVVPIFLFRNIVIKSLR